MNTDILYKNRPLIIEKEEAPSCFKDLHLDFIINSMISGRASLSLSNYFYNPLDTVSDIIYRQEVFKELEDTALIELLWHFVNGMNKLEDEIQLIDKLNYERQKEAFILDAALHYCEIVLQLKEAFIKCKFKAEALTNIASYLDSYTSSNMFHKMYEAVKQLIDKMQHLSYSVYIRNNHVTVSKMGDEEDFYEKAASLFSNWISSDKLSKKSQSYGTGIQMNQVEIRIFNDVVKLYPDTFQQITDFCHSYINFRDNDIIRFYNDIQFYLTWISYIEPMKKTGLPFCCPSISEDEKDCEVKECFDLSLAAKLIPSGETIVTNDFSYNGSERILIVTGPNQGGKTTFARMVGQTFYLASLGFPVPGISAELFLCTQIFTHFEKEETLDTAQGKLKDDIERIHSILTKGNSNSLLIMNETFSSTTLYDAISLGKEILSQILSLDMLCVYVTFIDEFTRGIPGTVSMVSEIDSDDSFRKTYKVNRRPSDGKAYAMAVAERYNLSYLQIIERMKE